MYANIDNDLGIEAIKYWFKKDPEAVLSRIAKEFIIEGLNLVLETNTFFLRWETLPTSKRRGYGSEGRPTYVSLVMAYLELKLHQETEKNMAQKNYISKNW